VGAAAPIGQRLDPPLVVPFPSHGEATARVDEDGSGGVDGVDDVREDVGHLLKVWCACDEVTPLKLPTPWPQLGPDQYMRLCGDTHRWRAEIPKRRR
jgi:hypothetical protein